MKPFKLDNFPKIESGFKIPDNYFENFSERLLNNLPEKEIKVIPIYEKRKTWIYAVAAVLVLAISVPVLNQYFNKSNEIENLVLENYLASNTSINDHDIADLLTDDDIQKIKIDMNIEDKTIENELSGNENLEEYLIN
ncbi:hypothetical protein [Flavobacterium sp.]|uniref:hypothetical protein n=1 Tax=Flavobacterium sp. TaxID=239 RepID=UPI00286E1FCD|nr:hypothetical protein [Flavobacterium sp.]